MVLDVPVEVDHEDLVRNYHWVGVICVTKRELRSHWGIIPAGAHVLVTKFVRDLELETKPCACCGLQAVMRKVPTWMLEPVARVARVEYRERLRDVAGCWGKWMEFCEEGR